DANHPHNSAADRGITARLYDAGGETRLMQELVLGVAGWRVVEAMAPDTELCHLNEGHAAFVVIERARSVRRRWGLSFAEALWATRAGNIFTTHTPVAAGFDRFPPTMIAAYGDYLGGLIAETDMPLAELLALGRSAASRADEPFNMAYLAMRGSARTIAVSRQHRAVSRAIFQPLFPRWPEREVPVDYVTNGIHVPSWDSADADRLWTGACGKERWRCSPDTLADRVAGLMDDDLWTMRNEGRQMLIASTRRRLRRHLAARGHSPTTVAAAEQVLDPNVLTLGFARRFTSYKRPNLLLGDLARLQRLLTDPAHPIQLIIAGKAHPADEEGKRMIQE
ncbi:MAG: alpha-glucan family phosphorylase, partial [Stellaceae bacterium]